MKIHHFASAAAAVLVVGMAAPAFAQSGYVGASYGTTRFESNDSTTLGVEGAWSIPAGEAFSLQVDGGYSNIDFGTDDSGSYQVSGTALFRGGSMNYGATLSYFKLDTVVLQSGSTTLPRYTNEFDSSEVSVFAQHIGENWVGLARLGYGQANVDYARGAVNPPAPALPVTAAAQSYDANYYDLRMDGQFFLNDNFSLNVSASYMDPENRKVVLSGAVGTEWKMANSPLSLGFGYAFNKDVDLLSVSLRGTFGAGSLIERAKTGPVSGPTSGLTHYTTFTSGVNPPSVFAP